MLNFYFLVRFLAHQDNIVRDRIADLFLDYKVSDDAIPSMIIHSIRSFGIPNNLSVLRLLPYQDLTSEQLDYLLTKREDLVSNKKFNNVLEQYDSFLKKTILSQNHQMVAPLVEELPPDFLKAIYLKKWKTIIHRDLFKVYSHYPSHQILDRIRDFIDKHKRKSFKRSYLTELRIWSEVFYIAFSKLKNVEQKKSFFKRTELYFDDLTKNLLAGTIKKKIYTLEACYHLISAGWWSMDYLLKKILDIFTLDCNEIVYEEAVTRLLEFDENEILLSAYELLMSNRVAEKAFPYVMKLFYLLANLDEENDFHAKSEKLLLAALKNEKHYTHKIQICLALSNLFSSKFVSQGVALLKNKSHFNFSVGSYSKQRVLLQQRLLVHSLLTGEKVEGLENFVNSYIEKKPSLSGRINASLFFYKKKDDTDKKY